MSKYQTLKNWQTDQRMDGENQDGDTLTAFIDVSDVQEIGTSRVWHAGAHRVRFVGNARDIPRGKTFVGETAWCDAERYARDAVTRHQHSRP